MNSSMLIEQKRCRNTNDTQLEISQWKVYSQIYGGECQKLKKRQAVADDILGEEPKILRNVKNRAYLFMKA